jgi:predicted ATPase/class 3 adenylate cyclase/Tfp pilus assembly protein PilF
MSLPSGTVTFLFTDIEGSTKLWEQHPEAMRTALARHDALLRQAIEDNNGIVFKTVGDAFCAAFATAPDALAAALGSQAALHAEPWPDDLVLRVRMALHTGAVELRDNDYFGQPLNRVARLLSAGHGGQVLLSDVAHDLTRDTLPPSAGLKPLGEHRLRDLGRPESVFQLLHPDLPDTFLPLKSLDNPDLPNNLPQQVTSFIGREKEMAEVKTLLGKNRLLTLTGSGGCGKTRLGLQVAAEVLENYPNGAWLVELAPLADLTLVPQAVASVLGVREEAGKPLVQTLVETLKVKRLLVVLDNCEHVLDACARLVDALLKNCPHVRVLASSREGLGIAGELTYRIPSLSSPDPRQAVTGESVGQYEAVQLFIERALFHLPTFAVTNQNAPALAAVCHRLDGIPLAIELAAARVRSLSVEEINSKLDNRFRLLTGGSRTALPRQQTLLALLEWSYNLLNEEEKALLYRLSVFAGGWTLEAAEAVGIGPNVEDWEVLDLLMSLVDKSLVVAEQEHGHTRYRLLETVRQYARYRLLEIGEGESEAVQERHRDFFLAMAEAAEPNLAGPEQGEWLNRLEAEHENLRAGLEWSLKEGNTTEGLRFCGALQRYWMIRGYLSDGREWCKRSLERAEAQERTRERAKTLNGAGALAYYQGDYASARGYHEESLTIQREIGNRKGIAASLNNLGNVANAQGDYASARTYHEESLVIEREIGDRNGIAASLNNLGNVANAQGDYASARGYHEESLAIRREIGDRQGIATSLNNLGNVAHNQGDYASARHYWEESLAIRREIGDRQGIATSLNNLGYMANIQGDYASVRGYLEESLAIRREIGDRKGIAASLNNLGLVAYHQGDYTSARGYLEESLTIKREIGDQRGIADSLEAFAGLAADQENPERAARLSGAAEALREEMGLPLAPNEKEEYDRDVAQVRQGLGEVAFAAAWEEGRAMTMEHAVEYALREEK